MKINDIDKIHDAGLITDDQRRKIMEHFRLAEEDGNKFLTIVSMLGGVLIVSGIILLVAAHWDGIPRGVKIASGIALMLGAHAGGWWLREVNGQYRKTGEALHLAGSGLFLANIALLGQIYNLVSRPPNAFLLWWAGIAALPWLLRSKAQHVLCLLAFSVWFGFEVNERGWLFCGDDIRQLLLYSMLGLCYLGAGWTLRRGAFADFAGITEKFGLLLFLAFIFPAAWKDCFSSFGAETNLWVLPALGLLALAALIIGATNLRDLTRQWRWTWLAALAGMAIFMASVWFGCWQLESTSGARHYYWMEPWNYVPGVLALFVYCMIQIQVGLQRGSPFLVNLGVAFIALDIIAAYLDLFGSMAFTGLMFLLSGVFLIVFGVYLEKKRRKLMKQIRPPAAKEVQ